MGSVNAVDISKEVVAKSSPPSKAKKLQLHCDILENKVDKLELEVASLKKKLASKPQVDTSNYKEKYLKLVKLYHECRDELVPF